jgi:hypothetical protein
MCGISVSCGGGTFHSCGSFKTNYVSSCGGDYSASCGGVSVGCGSSIYNTTSKQNSIVSETTKPKNLFSENTFSEKNTLVYDLDMDKKIVYAMVQIKDKGEVSYKHKEVPFDKLKKVAKKGDYDECNLYGVHIKKDGTVKIKSKELKPFKCELKNNVEDIKSHLAHLKEVKEELKMQEELEELDR